MGDLGAINFLHQRLLMPLFNGVWGKHDGIQKAKTDL